MEETQSQIAETTDHDVIDQYHALLDWLGDNAPLAYGVSDRTPVEIVTGMLDTIKTEYPHVFWRAECGAAGIVLKSEATHG